MRTILLIAFFLLISSTNILAKDLDFSIDTIRIKSAILNEQRSVLVYKSKYISMADSVKFIYLIDGENSTYRYNLIKERFGDSISNVVAVGIVYTDRNRDLLYIKSADKFLDFITSELIPIVERDFNIQTRILFGHSFGGGFTIYTMINKPNFFNCYIASSPTPIMDLIEKGNYSKIDSLSKSKTLFYLSCGSKDLRQVRKWSYRLKDNLSGLSFNKFDWRFTVFEGRDHNNSDGDALLSGLSHFFKQDINQL